MIGLAWTGHPSHFPYLDFNCTLGAGHCRLSADLILACCSLLVINGKGSLRISGLMQDEDEWSSVLERTRSMQTPKHGCWLYSDRAVHSNVIYPSSAYLSLIYGLPQPDCSWSFQKNIVVTITGYIWHTYDINITDVNLLHHIVWNGFPVDKAFLIVKMLLGTNLRLPRKK